jgi:ubiquinone/menaquinone biosynthesis C-methylase UbiE
MVGRMALDTIIDLNVRLSEATERLLKLPSEQEVWRSFEKQSAEAIRALPDGAVVLDVGGGRNFFYKDEVQPPGRLKIVAIDISQEELAMNKDADETHLADVSKEIPMPDESVDLLFTRALLEHVDGVPTAIREMARVLRPGGTALHVVPCRYSIFGIGARLLPFGPLLKLTLKLAPWFRSEAFGFEVFYDHCYPSALEEEFRAAGFSNIELEVSWACERFFVGVYPIYLAHAAYEQVMRRLRIRKFAAYTIVRATR